MGTVYRARDTMLDREVALKTIRTGPEVDPEIRERFYREARACARLVHPNIITVHDLGELDNTAFIAMELLVGRDFRQVISDKRRIPISTKIAMTLDLLSALGHAHSHGIVHRDIKPSNLFLVTNGVVKVLDFGIARLPSSRLTVAGRVLGTPNYMAPEQILAKPSDARADLFSAAVVLFELLVYVHPFQHALIPRRIIEGEPDSLFDHDSNTPVVLERVVARGLAKDPAQRYQTAEEFAGDLKAVLDAVRLDASPTFSRVELPSDRALTQSNPGTSTGVPILNAETGADDPDESRLARVLELLPAFEAAVDRKDQASAKKAFDELEAIEKADARFTEAVNTCRARLWELKPETVAVAAAAPVRQDPQPASVDF